MTVGNDLDANKINASGTITGNVTGDLTGNADTATNAINATNATNATTATNCTRQVLGGNGLTGGGKLTTNRTLAVGALDATIIVGADGIRVDQNQLNFTPAANDGQININASNGLEATGSNATADQSGSTTRLISGIDATTSQKGVVQLNNTTTSTSQTQAATANAAKKAYDRVATYAPKKDGTNATGTWGIDISGNAATADLAANVSGTVANADLAAEANLVKIDQSTGNTNRPFVFIGGTANASGSYEQLLRDSAATCYINPNTNTIGATKFISTDLVQGVDIKATTRVISPKYTGTGSITIQPGGTTAKTLTILAGKDESDAVGGNIVIGAGNTTGGGGHIYFRGNGGTDMFRFAKSGQTAIEGFLSFESLTADRTFTYPDYTGTVALRDGGTFEKIVFNNDEKGDLTEDGELRFDGSQGLILYRNQQGMGSTPGAVTVLDGANVEAGDGLTISNLLAGSTSTGRITFAVDSTVARQSGGAVTLATTANKVKLTANTSNTWREFVWSDTEGAGGSSKSVYVNGSGTAKAAINSSTGDIQSPQFNIVGGGKLGPATGNYGNVQVNGSNLQGGYAGFSIQGAAVFMRKSTTFGLYDDTNNSWVLKHVQNGATNIYYAGTSKLVTNSSGVTVSGDVVSDVVAVGESRKLEINCNDGLGNANICFNHANGVAQQTGSSARISSDVDNASGKIEFQVGNNSTANTAKSLTEIMGVTTSGVTATKFIGPLEGDVTGNVSGSSGSTTGNAATATQLKTARNLWGVSFNGTANISGAMTGVNSITGANSNMTIQPAESTTARNLTLHGNNDTDGAGGALILGHKDRGHIYFRTGNTYRFAKKGQTTIEGILNFDSLSADRTYSFPNKGGTIALTGEPVDDADKLDGLQSTQFLRSDANDTYSGGRLDIDSDSASGHYWGAGVKYTTKYVHTNADSWGFLLRNSGSGGMEIKVAKETGTSGGNATFRDFKIGGGTASLTYDGKKVWYEGNDGASSGLDADKLDGKEGSQFLRSDANDSASGTLTFNGLVNVRGNMDFNDGQILRMGSSDDVAISFDGSSNWLDVNLKQNGIIFQDSGSDKLIIEDTGVIRPAADLGTQLGTSTRKFSNVYTGQVTFPANSTDTAHIKTTVDGNNTYMDFVLSDDFSQEMWRYRFTPSGGTIFTVAEIRPTSTTKGRLTVTGDIVASNGVFASAYNSAGDNIDHIWHDETNNQWNFVSDSTYKAAGNSKVKAATFVGALDGTASYASNADKLDGVSSGSFLRSDAADVKTGGTLTFNDNIYCSFGNAGDFQMFCNGSHMYMDLEAGIGNLIIRDGSSTRFTFDDNGTFTATSVVKGSQWQGGLRNSDVLNAQASTAAGAKGSYGFMTLFGQTANFEPGTGSAGADIKWSNAAGNTSNSAPSGNWRLFGRIAGESGDQKPGETSLWIRYA